MKAVNRMRPLLVSIYCALGSVAIILALQILSARDNRGAFTRVFPPYVIEKSKTIDLKFNSYYLAGGAKNYVYFGNVTAPLHVVALNMANADTNHISLSVDRNLVRKASSVRLKVDSPNFYLLDGILPLIIKGDVGRWRGEPIAAADAYFTNCEPIGSSSFVIRTLSSGSRENVLGKENAIASSVRLFDNILKKQIDGIFCTDGMLHYSPELNRIIYLYYYRNQYLQFDTTFQEVDSGRTIDGTFRARIRVDSITSNNSVTLSAPPYLVNKRSAVSGHFLFVYSLIMAANESEPSFSRACVVDVYDLEQKRYKASFYIMDHENKKMTDFGVFGRKLVALYDHYAIIYNLNTRYFEK